MPTTRKKPRSKPAKKRTAKKNPARKAAKKRTAKKNPARKVAKKTTKKRNPSHAYAVTRRKLVKVDTPAELRGAEKQLVQLAKQGKLTRGELYEARRRVKALAKARGVKLAKRNPAHGVPVTFRLLGKPPHENAIETGRMVLCDILTHYDPAKTSSTRCYWPWVVRRWSSLGQPSGLLTWCAIDLANENVIALYVDEDRKPVMAQVDRDLCPDIDGAPLVWLKVTNADKARAIAGSHA